MEPQAAQPATQQPTGSKNLLVLMLVLIVVAVLAAGVLYYLNRQKTDEPTKKTTTGLERDSITIAQFVPFDGVFPNSVADFNDEVFNNNIFEGLGRVVNGEVKPALAESWTNPDNTTWRFKLQQGVKFHNGDSLKASDVKFSIDQALEKEWPNASRLQTVKSVTVVDDNTVDIKTASPDPVLLNRLVYAFVVSEKQFKERKEDEEAVGTGPYKFVSLDKKTAVLEANPSYYKGKPKVKKVIYKFFADDVTDKQLVASLKKGEVDLVRLSDIKLSKTVGSKFYVKSLADPFVSFLWLDTGRNKSPYVDETPNPLKSKEVRQAMYKAIDVNKLIKEASLSAAPASQMVTEAIFGYNPDITRSKPNVEEAKNLLGKTGVPNGFNMTLDVPGYYEPVGEVIAADLAKIGIIVKVKPIASRDEAGIKWWDKKDVSAYIQDYSADTFDAGEIFTSILHSGGDGNYIALGYSSDEMDKLAEEISLTFTPKERVSKLQTAMAKTMEEMPMIPLFSQKFYYVVRDNYDWTPTAFGAIYPSEISGRDIPSE